MLILRGTDKHGCGAFGASRGSRTHHGIDISAVADTDVIPQRIGKVTKLGWPYSAEGKKHFRYVQITDEQGLAHRYFYIAPSVVVGDSIALDTVIGKVQDLNTIYPGIKNHIHYEVIDKTGRYLDPMEFLV